MTQPNHFIINKSFVNDIWNLFVSSLEDSVNKYIPTKLIKKRKYQEMKVTLLYIKI